MLEQRYLSGFAPRDSDYPRRQRQLRKALAPYIDIDMLRILAATPSPDIRKAMRGAPSTVTPEAVHALLDAMAAIYAPDARTQVKGAADIAPVLMARMGGLDQEQMVVTSLDTKNQVIDITVVYQGSVDSALIRIGELFKPAIRCNATTIILAHNHPSGQVDPSPQDVLVTRQVVSAGKQFDITVLDHLIVSPNTWYSFRERLASLF